MDQELKQRLIGAIVITALAAIFVPMLFDDPIEESGQIVNELTLPEPPVENFAKTAERLPESNRLQDSDVTKEKTSQITDESEGLTQEELDYMGPVEDGSELQPFDKKSLAPAISTVDPSTIKPATPDSSTPTLAGSKTVSVAPLPVAELVTWYIQPGSFSKRDNAFALRDKLRSQGFTASVEEFDTAGGKSYRVLVGPETDKSKAQAMRERLDAANKSKSLLLSVNKPRAIEPTTSGSQPVKAADPVKSSVTTVPSSNELVKWYIQLGSFSKQENADSLRDKLRSQGFPAVVTVVQTAQGKAYRLRVGPELDKKRAENQLSQLDKQHNLKGFLVSE